jgi:hypothetical protein
MAMRLSFSLSPKRALTYVFRLLRRIEGSNRYGLVLLTVLASSLFNLAAPQRGWPRIMGTLLEGTALLSAVWIARMPRKRLATAIGLAVTAAAVIQVIVGSEVEGTGRLLYGALTSAVLIVIARGVWRHLDEGEGVTLDAVYGALAIYVMIGAFFGAVDQFVNVINHGRFLVGNPGADFEDVLYFSFSTLTTLGYGDVTPATRAARSLAVAEGLIGQFYLVTVLALLVSGFSHRWARAAPTPTADARTRAARSRQEPELEDA